MRRELAPWTDLTRTVAERARGYGLDLVQPLRLGWYNAGAPPDLRIGGGAADDRLALVIGNTRALWPCFEAALWREVRLQDEPHPLDRYCTEAVATILSAGPAPIWLRFAHELDPPPPIPIQRVAAAAGLAHLSPSHLSIHPVHGPWIALRAVVVFDVEGPSEHAGAAPDPCSGCQTPCLPALERALRPAPADDPETAWRRWLQVRDVCPVGRSARYGEDQIHHHYAKRAHLPRA